MSKFASIFAPDAPATGETGTVLIREGIVLDEIVASVRVVGIQAVAYVTTEDKFTEQRRIVLVDQLAQGNGVIVDTATPAGVRTAVALAEGMVRAYALTLDGSLRPA